MPKGRIVRELDTDYADLREKLLTEWQHPDEEAEEPVIIETVDGPLQQATPTHLYVIWNAWQSQPQRRRSEMIMDVYEQVRGRGAALNVTLAMGLTPDEARRLGLQWAAVPTDAAA